VRWLDYVAAALRRNPVRAYLYGCLVPGEALAVSYGLINDAQGALWLGLGAAVLLVPVTEAVRSQVTPSADPRDAAGRLLRPPTSY
jgi:hypothetical protein